MTNLIDVKNLTVRFSGERTVHAVNNVDLSLKLQQRRHDPRGNTAIEALTPYRDLKFGPIYELNLRVGGGARLQEAPRATHRIPPRC